MAQTYPSIAAFTAGQTLTAAQMNDMRTWLANQRVPPLIVATFSATQPITNATDTGLAFAAGATVTDGSVTTGATSSTLANAGKITVDTAGIYLVTYCVSFAANGTGARHATIAKNGTGSPSTGTGAGWSSGVVNASATSSLSGSVFMDLVATDYLQLVVYQNSTTTLNAATLTGAASMQVVWVGQKA